MRFWGPCTCLKSLLFPHRMKGCQSSREAENSGLLSIWVDRTKRGASRSLCDQNLSCRCLGWLLLALPGLPQQREPFPSCPKAAEQATELLGAVPRRHAKERQHGTEAASTPVHSHRKCSTHTCTHTHQNHAHGTRNGSALHWRGRWRLLCLLTLLEASRMPGPARRRSSTQTLL